MLSRDAFCLVAGVAWVAYFGSATPHLSVRMFWVMVTVWIMLRHFVESCGWVFISRIRFASVLTDKSWIAGFSLGAGEQL
ncbi:hypothetical protein EMIT0P265_40579 [Pseudomonas zeae]